MLSRRAFIGLKKALEQPEEITSRGIIAGLEPYTGTWSDNEIRHLLRRTTFGVKQAHLEALRGITASQAVDIILMEQAVLPNPVNNYNGFPSEKDGKPWDIVDPEVPIGKDWTTAKFDLDVEYWRNMSLKDWWLRSILEQAPSIHEKMTFFWHNHIPIQMLEVYNARLSYPYLLTLRSNALKNVKTLIKEVTISPAMLFYLNGTYNEKWAPDENYARELQELFCIGKGVDSKFTEDDVKAAAKILTGWKADWDKPSNVYFNSSVHDTTDKQFSSFYGNKIIKGKTGQDGKSELDELLTMLFDNNETALFLCRKLYRFFVYAQIDTTIEDNIIKPLAALLRKSNYDIKPVLEKLLKSQHFFDAQNRACMIKTPLDFVLGICREFEIKFPEPTDYKYNFIAMSYMYWTLENMQCAVGDPPNVAGWPAWYQKPQLDRAWITTATITKRAQNSDMMIFWGYGPDDKHLSSINEFEFTKSLKNPSDVNSLINEVLVRMFPFEVDDNVKKHLKSLLLYNQTNEQYWTDAWADYLKTPTDEMKINNVRWRLRPFYQYLMQMDEYQLI
jgi:Protein of unknown function (DUF1800)